MKLTTKESSDLVASGTHRPRSHKTSGEAARADVRYVGLFILVLFQFFFSVLTVPIVRMPKLRPPRLLHENVLQSCKRSPLMVIPTDLLQGESTDPPRSTPDLLTPNFQFHGIMLILRRTRPSRRKVCSVPFSIAETHVFARSTPQHVDRVPSSRIRGSMTTRASNGMYTSLGFLFGFRSQFTSVKKRVLEDAAVFSDQEYT